MDCQLYMYVSGPITPIHHNCGILHLEVRHETLPRNTALHNVHVATFLAFQDKIKIKINLPRFTPSDSLELIFVLINQFFFIPGALSTKLK